MDRRLKQFLAVAEAGSVSSAAEVLRVSQPTISVNLRRLEAEHGVSLFTRNSRGMVLTSFGKVLYEHARAMNRLEAHATREMQMMKAGQRPTLSLGCGFTWWNRLLRGCLRDLTRARPEAAVQVDICSSLDGLRSLLSGDIQFFFGTRVTRVSDGIVVDFEHLFSVEDAVFVRRGHPLAGASVPEAALSRYPRLDVAPFVKSHFGIAETAPHGLGTQTSPARYASNSMTAGIAMLHDSDAYLLYPEQSESFLAEQGIVRLALSDAVPEPTGIGIYTLPEAEPTDLALEMLERVRDACR